LWVTFFRKFMIKCNKILLNNEYDVLFFNKLSFKFVSMCNNLLLIIFIHLEILT